MPEFYNLPNNDILELVQQKLSIVPIPTLNINRNYYDKIASIIQYGYDRRRLSIKQLRVLRDFMYRQ